MVWFVKTDNSALGTPAEIYKMKFIFCAKNFLYAIFLDDVTKSGHNYTK